MTFSALDLPLPARIAICACAATVSVLHIHSMFMLGGTRAVRGLYWSDSGPMYARVGPCWRELTVIVAPGSCRLGRNWLLLWLDSCDGMFGICIDGAGQNPRAFRRLCRQLENRGKACPDEGQDLC